MKHQSHITAHRRASVETPQVGHKFATRQARLPSASAKGTEFDNQPGLNSPVVVRLCLASVLVGCTGAFQVFAPGGSAVFVYAPLLLACWLIIIQIISPVALPRERWSELLPLLLLCLGPALSILWSAFPQKTTSDIITLLVFGLLGIVISKYISFDQRLVTTAYTLGILIGLSVAVVFFAPSYGIDIDSRAIAWRGVFSNKNSLGRVAAIELLVCVFLAVRSQSHRRLMWLAGSCLSVVVLINSDSQTALLAALVGLAVVWIMRLRPWTPVLAARIPSVLLAAYFLLSSLIPAVGPIIAGYVSRDPTLTGRTVLWQLSNQFADQKPITGWGFGAVWQVDGGVGQTISRSLTFIPGSAHNGLIDLRLQLGVIGVILLAIGLWILIRQALSSQAALSGPSHSWKVGYLAVLLTMDLAESTFYFGLTWFLAWIFLSGDRKNTRRYS